MFHLGPFFSSYCQANFFSTIEYFLIGKWFFEKKIQPVEVTTLIIIIGVMMQINNQINHIIRISTAISLKCIHFKKPLRLKAISPSRTK